jgi:hypothetical protein
VFTVETLEHLRRGGRIGGAQAFLGGLLDMKPSWSWRRRVEPVGACARRPSSVPTSSTKAGALGGPVHLATQHAAAPQRPPPCRSRKRPERYRVHHGRSQPTVATHTGPGTWAWPVFRGKSMDPLTSAPGPQRRNSQPAGRWLLAGVDRTAAAGAAPRPTARAAGCCTWPAGCHAMPPVARAPVHRRTAPQLDGRGCRRHPPAENRACRGMAGVGGAVYLPSLGIVTSRTAQVVTRRVGPWAKGRRAAPSAGERRAIRLTPAPGRGAGRLLRGYAIMLPAVVIGEIDNG